MLSSSKAGDMINSEDPGPQNMAIMYGTYQRSNLGRFGMMSVRATPTSHYVPRYLQEIQYMILCMFANTTASEVSEITTMTSVGVLVYDITLTNVQTMVQTLMS